MSNNSLLDYLNQKSKEKKYEASFTELPKAPPKPEKALGDYTIADFHSYIESKRKGTPEEKVNGFGEVLENMMTIVMKIPGFIDNTISKTYQKLDNITKQADSLEKEINAIKLRVGNASPSTQYQISGVPPGPPSLQPQAPKIEPKPSPTTLRGAIMSELKAVFAKRKDI